MLPCPCAYWTWKVNRSVACLPKIGRKNRIRNNFLWLPPCRTFIFIFLTLFYYDIIGTLFYYDIIDSIQNYDIIGLKYFWRSKWNQTRRTAGAYHHKIMSKLAFGHRLAVTFAKTHCKIDICLIDTQICVYLPKHTVTPQSNTEPECH